MALGVAWAATPLLSSHANRACFYFLHRLGRRLGVLPVVYTLPNGAAFTYHDNGNLMGRKLGLRVRQPHGLAKDVDAAGFFGVEARSSDFGGAAGNATMYVVETIEP